MVFASEALKYFEAGYNVLPLAVNGKMPVISGWQEWGTNKQAEFQIDSWCNSYGNGNIGLPLGECNGVIALDFDYDLEGLHDKIQAIIPPSPVRKVGAKGFTAFYRYNGERNKRYRKDGQTIFEVLSTGTQTVMPLSIHPDTGLPYQWVTPDTLLDMKVKDLPSLPADFLAKMDDIFGIHPRLIESGTVDKPELDVVRHALQYIPSSEYALWVEIGMALNHSYGDAAFDIWDRWSATATNYDSKNMNYKWSSFGRYKGSPVAAGTILHFAMQYGWLPESAPRWMSDSAVITIGGKKEAAVSTIAAPSCQKGNDDYTPGDSTIPEANPTTAETLPQHLLDAPNLIGELAEWINTTSIRYQPVLAIAAAIPAIGALMAHKFRTPTDLRSNIYTVGICGAGLGKDHARKCINMLFDSIHMGQHLMGDFASDTAIISALYARNGVGLSMNDEIGDMIASISGKAAGSFELRIMRLTKELFSSANTVFRGKEYANHDGKMDAKVINQPCLSVYGTSTPGQFFDALSGKKVVDGFLPRWLVFEGDGHAKKLEKGGVALEPPFSLVERCNEILATNHHNSGGGLTVGRIKPAIVDITDGARDKFLQLEAWAETMRQQEYDKKTGLDALFSRVVEHAYKLALVGHSNSTINGTVAAWACEVVQWLSVRMATLARERIGDNDYEREYLAIAEFVRASGEAGVYRRSVVRKFRSMEVRQINNVLAHLLESGMVQGEEVVGNNNKKTQKFTIC
jgi:hypothetical protein